MKLYVGNLAFTVSEEELTKIFTEFGEVETVDLIKDRFSGESKGFGFVDMPNNSEADVAIKALNGTIMGGRNIKVNQAQPKTKSSAGGRSSGGGRRR